MTHEDVWHAIEQFANEHHMSCSGLAKCSGLDPTTFNKSKRASKYGQPRWLSMETISKVLDATHTTADQFADMFPDSKQIER